MNDAVSYFEHIKFYLDSIQRGIYPLWDPSRVWGVPNHFFLRRIGEFNPLYFLILISNKLGLSYTLSYLFFLALYYFIGMIGFYLLAKGIFRDSKMAFIAYLLLMFSSLGTRLFDSYVILVFVPMVWFFFFLMSFTEKQQKYSFLGMIFCLMIIATTYVPFYFLTAFLIFLICFVVLNVRRLKTIYLNYYQFMKNHKIFAFLCIAVLALSLIPGIILFQEAEKGEFVMPLRQTDSTMSNTLGVDIKRVVEGGILMPMIPRGLFSNQRNFQLGTFYVPHFAFLILLLGAFLSVNKKLIFFTIWGFLIFLLASTDATPIFPFLYKHVFFFKLFRNLQFFLWVVLLPIFVLFVVEQLKIFLHGHSFRKKSDILTLLAILMVHIGFAVYLYYQTDIIISSYIVIGLSLLFFILCFFRVLKSQGFMFLSFLLILIAIQPLELYHYLQRSPPESKSGYRYTRPYETYLKLRIPTEEEAKEFAQRQKSAGGNGYIDENYRSTPNIYLGGKWFNVLLKHLRFQTLDEYLRYKLIVYDRLQWMDDEHVDFERIEHVFSSMENMAIVSSEKPLQNMDNSSVSHHPFAQIVTKDSREVQVLESGVNSVKLKTDFDRPKFLVYNQNFHSGWKAFINDQRTDLWRANFAFKGLWVPAGENVVTLSFGSRWRYFLGFLLIGIFQIVFFFLVILGVKPYMNRPFPVTNCKSDV